jgi:class 3 adenylate cyclase/tetratricopeptide (TPR) repeat protein
LRPEREPPSGRMPRRTELSSVWPARGMSPGVSPGESAPGRGTPMKCARCLKETTRGRKFCPECGEAISPACPRCGAETLPGDKFCGECGEGLGGPLPGPGGNPSFEEKLARLQRYLPQGVTEKILAQKDKIEGERKQVTVMFCDLAGSTALAEKLGAEGFYAFLERFFEILIHKVLDCGGTVNKMTGDGIMALFGAPIALEGAPARALRSALAITCEMARFSDRFRRSRRVPALKVRIGIHTGSVVVGSLGNDLRVEFSAVGDTVNLASRMEGLAEPGTVCVTEETFRLTEGLFRFEALGEKKVKGKDRPVRVYRLIGAGDLQTRFDVSAERGLTPFIGRERELELLLDGLARCREGKGRALSILAEAGLGKSRLLHEFRKALSGEDVVFFEGRCLSHGRGTAYHPFVEILRALFDLGPEEETEALGEKISKGLRRLKIPDGPNTAAVLEILGAPEKGSEKTRLSPDARKDLLQTLLKRILLSAGEGRPLILAVEDLHWIDQNSEEVLKSLLDAVPGAGIFLLCTFRPEFRPSWSGKSYHTQVALNRLSVRESLAMFAHLLEGREADPAVEEMLLEKTEGVPFFIEEFIRSWKDLGVLKAAGRRYRLADPSRKGAVPSTLNEVIMARVDALPERAREILKAGSVIEREFSHELIRSISGCPETDLLGNLALLKEAELLYERGIHPQTSYVFRHALTRDVIYDGLLTAKRNVLHEAVGRAIETIYSRQLGDYYPALAEHFSRSENYAKGAEYARAAAKAARGKSAYKEAIRFAKKEVFCLERLPGGEPARRRILEARIALANYCLNLNYHTEAKEAIEPILERAEEQNDPRALAPIYTVLGAHGLFVEEDQTRGREYIEKALRLAEEAKDYFSLWNACYILGCFLSWNGEFAKAEAYFFKTLDLSLAARNTMGITSAQINLGMNYIFQGKIAPAHRISRESMRLAEESGDIYLKGMAHAFHGTSCYYRGDFREAEDHLLRGISFGERTRHFVWGAWAAAFLGDMYFDLGEYAKAQEAYGKALAFIDGEGFSPSWRALLHAAILRARAVCGGAGETQEDLPRAFAANKNRGFAGWIALYIAEVLLQGKAEDLPEAEAWGEKALALHREGGMNLLAGRDYLFRAELEKRRGNVQAAQEQLTRAMDVFRDCGAEGYLRKAKKEWLDLAALALRS